MIVYKSALNAAIDMAKKADLMMKARVGAVIVSKSGHIISSGFNSRKTHPMQKQYSVRNSMSPERNCLHAEISALVKMRKKGNAIYVTRILKDDTIAPSRPCPTCMHAIEESGIEWLVYLNDEDDIIVEKVN